MKLVNVDFEGKFLVLRSETEEEKNMLIKISQHRLCITLRAPEGDPQYEVVLPLTVREEVLRFF